jgi:hypothetical protein
MQPKLGKKQKNKPKTSLKYQNNETFTKLRMRRLGNKLSKVVLKLPS